MSLVKSEDSWQGCNFAEVKKTKYSIIRSNTQYKSWDTAYVLRQPATNQKVRKINM